MTYWKNNRTTSFDLYFIAKSGKVGHPPALGMLMERIVLTFPSQPRTLTAVVVENRSVGPTHRRDL